MQPDPTPQDAPLDSPWSDPPVNLARRVGLVAAAVGLLAAIVVIGLIGTGVFSDDDIAGDTGGALSNVAAPDADMTVFLDLDVQNDEAAVDELIGAMMSIEGIAQADWLAPLIVRGISPGGELLIVEQAVITVDFEDELTKADRSAVEELIDDLVGVTGTATP